MILLMFGPLHGTTFEVNPITGPNKDELTVVEPEQISYGFESYDFGRPYTRSDTSMKIKYHRYERVEGFSSDNGEDCELYMHTSRCCEKGVTREQLDGQDERRADKRRRRQRDIW